MKTIGFAAISVLTLLSSPGAAPAFAEDIWKVECETPFFQKLEVACRRYGHFHMKPSDFDPIAEAVLQAWEACGSRLLLEIPLRPEVIKSFDAFAEACETDWWAAENVYSRVDELESQFVALLRTLPVGQLQDSAARSYFFITERMFIGHYLDSLGQLLLQNNLSISARTSLEEALVATGKKTYDDGDYYRLPEWIAITRNYFSSMTTERLSLKALAELLGWDEKYSLGLLQNSRVREQLLALLLDHPFDPTSEDYERLFGPLPPNFQKKQTSAFADRLRAGPSGKIDEDELSFLKLLEKRTKEGSVASDVAEEYAEAFLNVYFRLNPIKDDGVPREKLAQLAGKLINVEHFHLFAERALESIDQDSSLVFLNANYDYFLHWQKGKPVCSSSSIATAWRKGYEDKTFIPERIKLALHFYLDTNLRLRPSTEIEVLDRLFGDPLFGSFLEASVYRAWGYSGMSPEEAVTILPAFIHLLFHPDGIEKELTMLIGSRASSIRTILPVEYRWQLSAPLFGLMLNKNHALAKAAAKEFFSSFVTDHTIGDRLHGPVYAFDVSEIKASRWPVVLSMVAYLSALEIDRPDERAQKLRELNIEQLVNQTLLNPNTRAVALAWIPVLVSSKTVSVGTLRTWIHSIAKFEAKLRGKARLNRKNSVLALYYAVLANRREYTQMLLDPEHIPFPPAVLKIIESLLLNGSLDLNSKLI